MPLQDLTIFSTCTQSVDVPPERYAAQVARVAGWSEQAGLDGMLIYADHRLVDPWLVAGVVCASTTRLCPLVATQPVYMHPYSAAKMVSSLATLYDRRVYLNMIAGGFVNDLRSLDDQVPHDRRYDRLIEYTRIVQDLLACTNSDQPLTREGEFYSVRNLRMTPPLPAHLKPRILVSGSSEAGLSAARLLGATAVQYPTPPEQMTTVPCASPIEFGIRVGIVARERSEQAWQIAEKRFPESRSGRVSRRMATKVSDSEWHKNLQHVSESLNGRSTYWLVPFEQYQTMCPYLVGSYDEVALALASYIGKGYRTFILDIPMEDSDLSDAAIAFERALATLSDDEPTA